MRVYELNGSNTWSQVGSDYDGDGSTQYFGHSVSMNAKGDKFIGGAYYANSQRGYAKVFESNEFCATPLTLTIYDGVFSNFQTRFVRALWNIVFVVSSQFRSRFVPECRLMHVLPSLIDL